nr:uncharacterized protein LOC111504220 [Leptinotarsa decemlineata]
MDTDWTTIEGAGRKRECIKQNPRYYYKRHHKKHDEETKENVGPGISKREEDNLALKIHGLYYESDNNSSDSGKSSFDEEYYKYKPQPIEINSSQVVVIRNKNIIKEQGNRNKTNHNVKHPKKKRGIPNKGRNIKSNHKKGTPRIAVNEGAFEVNKNMGKGSTSKKPIFIISDKCDSTIPTSNAGNFVDQNQSVSSSFWNNSVEEPKISETQYDSTLTKSTMFFSAQHQSNNKTTPMDSDYPRRDKKLRREMLKTPLVNSVQQHLVNYVSNEGKIYNDTHNRFSNNFNEALNHLVQHQSINKTTPMDSEYPRRDKELRTEMPKTPLVNSVQQHLVNYVPNEGKIYNDTHNRFSNNFNEALNHLVQHQSINKTTPMDSEYLRRDKEVRTEMPKTPLVNSVQQHLVNYVSNEGKIYNDTHNRFSNNFNEALNHLVQHQSINKTTPMDAEYLRIDKELRTEMPKTPLVNSVQQHLVNYVPNEGNIYNDTHNRFSNDLNEAVNHLMHIYAEPNHSKHIQVASNREQKILEDASKKQPDPKTPETQKNTFLRFGSNESSNSSSNYSETVVENSAKEKIDIARAHVNKIEVEKENYPWVAKEYTIRDVWKTPKDQEIKPATPKLESYNEIVPRNDILISNNKTIMRHPQNPQNETANNLLYALDEDEPRHSPAEFSKVYVPTARKQPGCNRTEDKNNPWVAEENSSMGMSKTRKDPQIKPGTPILESNTRIVPKNDISTSSIEAIVQQPQNPLNERSDNLSPIMRNEVSEPSIAQEDDINLLAGVRKGGLLAALSLLCCCCSKVHIG